MKKKTNVEKVLEALPFGVWMTPREVRDFAKTTGLTHPQAKKALANAILRGFVERRPISPKLLKRDRAMVERLVRENPKIRKFHKNLRGQSHYATPRYQYRVIGEYETFDLDDCAPRKLTTEQSVYVLRNPDGLSATQLSKFLPVGNSAIYCLWKRAKEGTRNYKAFDPKYNALSDDEVRELAFPDGAQIIPKAKRSGKLRRGFSTVDRVPDPEDQWDVTNFG